ncbi:hypothetical protein CA235_09680 [Sphingomonas sp. ABOLF]|uniref:GTA-gp10 family protein n=1 Tax=Sphingomonas sp. ABOLF TaxID=1985879 RepID=UPI000F7F0661|nr:GTA-gp10 family protein [Sphingomonas sp. ABOLF]RSV15196.1 hypothetical protein CA235_09680 [Sphingomonas sp. ABOLF]
MTRARKTAAAAAALEPPAEQPVAIEDRGEHELTLAGVTYRLRPSHPALVAIEKKTGRSNLALVRLGNTQDLSNEQLGIIAAELVRAGATDAMTRAVSAERFGELIYEEGAVRACARLTLCLLDAATGGRTASGEAKAAVTTTETDTTAA